MGKLRQVLLRRARQETSIEDDPAIACGAGGYPRVGPIPNGVLVIRRV
jgi:hypothetical protein